MNLHIGYENARRNMPPLAAPPDYFNLTGLVTEQPPQFQKRGGSSDVAEAVRAYQEGLTYFLMGDWRNAAVGFQESVRIAPSSQTYVLLGHAVFNLQDFLRAASYFEKAVKLDPKYLAAHISLAIAYDHLGKTRKAITAINKAIHTDPRSPESHFLLGHLRQKIEHWAEAERSYQEAIRLRNDFTLARESLAKLHYQLGYLNEQERETRFRRAIEEYERLAGVGTFGPGVYNNIGYIYDQLGESEKASEYYQRAVESLGDDLASLTELGTTMLDVGRYGEARSVFAKALNLVGKEARGGDVSCVMLLTNLGVASLGLYGARPQEEGDTDLLSEAEESFRAALSLEPHYIHAQTGLGASYYEQGRTDEAIEAFKRALEIDPDNTTAQNNLRTLLEERLERNLVEEGLLKRVRGPIANLELYRDRTPIVISGRPLSETLVEERR
jgi:tetratricopeptide (TPR) repeat protein